MRRDYDNFRTVVMLEESVRLCLRVRRCQNTQCPRYRVPYRPESEGRFALPEHEFGLDVVALVGMLRHREYRSVPEIHAHLRGLGVCISERSVTNLMGVYEQLLAVSLADDRRLRSLLAAQQRVVLAIDGLQPHKGHEVLWVVRECLSGEILLARTMLSATTGDLVGLLSEVAAKLPVPPVGLVSDGQVTIRRAAQRAFPGVPHQLCQYHYLREAARPAFEADRAAKKQLKKRVRGIREIERSAEAEDSEKADIVRGYCAAVRSALDDDSPPPLRPPGLRLKRCLEQIHESLGEAEKKGGASPGSSKKSRP